MLNNDATSAFEFEIQYSLLIYTFNRWSNLTLRQAQRYIHRQTAVRGFFVF